MTQKARYSQAKRITLIGAVINAFLGVIKLIGGVLFHSHALIADGVHSLSDLVIDAMVLFASKYGSQDADDTHPYGHQRIETAGTLMLASFLILAGVGIAWDALHALLAEQLEQPGQLALPIAVLSIISNEFLFYYTKKIGHQIQSALIVANAWHHRSDSASSAVVALGLIGSLWGYVYLDALAAIVVGMLIVHMGIHYGWSSVKELIDTAIDPQMLQKIEHVIEEIDGVKKIHQLRSRSMGGDVIIDVHVLVDPFISVSEGHYIAQHVHYLLMKTLPKVKDVTVHIDPEDDEIFCPSVHLPNRKKLEDDFLITLQKQCPGLLNWSLHYLDGHLLIDLFFDSTIIVTDNVRQQIATLLDANTLTLIKEVRLYNQCGVITP